MCRLGMNVPDNKNIDFLMKTIKEAGFECVMVNYPKDDKPVYEILECAYKYSLSISSVHAPIADINSFWQEGCNGDKYLEFIKKRVDFCKENGVNTLVAHTTYGNDIPNVSDIGFSRFSLLNEYAEQNGIHICYENVNEVEVLKSVLVKAPQFHGFCWDIGHNMAYTPQVDFCTLFKNRLKYVHIHDNFGITKPGNIGVDLHEMPFSCNIDWQWYADTLKRLNYNGDLNFECSYRLFLESDSVKFINKAYERMNRLKDMIK